jgi:hypothetical protein
MGGGGGGVGPDGRRGGGGGGGTCDGTSVHALVLCIGMALGFLEEVGRGGVELTKQHLAPGGSN